MTIIGILAAMVTLAVSDAGQRQQVQAAAERMALAIELARTEALTRNEVWGLKLEDTSYWFGRHQPDEDAWTPVDAPPFLPHALAPGLRIQARTDRLGRRVRSEETGRGLVRSGGGQDDGIPDIAILPGGEVTPFEILVSGADAPTWLARSDGISSVTAARATDLARDDA